MLISTTYNFGHDECHDAITCLDPHMTTIIPVRASRRAAVTYLVVVVLPRPRSPTTRTSLGPDTPLVVLSTSRGRMSIVSLSIYFFAMSSLQFTYETIQRMYRLHRPPAITDKCCMSSSIFCSISKYKVHLPVEPPRIDLVEPKQVPAGTREAQIVTVICFSFADNSFLIVALLETSDIKRDTSQSITRLFVLRFTSKYRTVRS